MLAANLPESLNARVLPVGAIGPILPPEYRLTAQGLPAAYAFAALARARSVAGAASALIA